MSCFVHPSWKACACAVWQSVGANVGAGINKLRGTSLNTLGWFKV